MKRSAIRRGTPLRRTSEKQRSRIVAVNKSRDAIRERSAGLCEASIGGVCNRVGVDPHHVQRRSQGGGDGPENLLWVCRPCHNHIHSNVRWAQSNGFLSRK